MHHQSFDSEADLLQALRAGDDAALSYIYRRFKPMVARFVEQNNGRPADADDLLQESIILLYENLRQPAFVLTCQVKTYLYSVIRNRWLAQLRTQQRIRDIEEYLPDLVDNSVDEEASWPDEAQLGTALAAMGNPCRSILVGYYYDRRSLEELANQLNYASANVVKQLKFRCIDRLKKQFSGFNAL